MLRMREEEDKADVERKRSRWIEICQRSEMHMGLGAGGEGGYSRKLGKTEGSRES